jgi:hypothetical protein
VAREQGCFAAPSGISSENQKDFMQDTHNTGFAERLKTAAAARQALLANFKPRAAQTAPEPIDRAERRAAELRQVRLDRADAKTAKREAAAQALAADAQAQADLEAAALEAKRGARRERKALSAAEAKAKRDARYAARKAR